MGKPKQSAGAKSEAIIVEKVCKTHGDVMDCLVHGRFLVLRNVPLVAECDGDERV